MTIIQDTLRLFGITRCYSSNFRILDFIILNTEQNYMGVDTIPNHLTHDGSNGSTFLFNCHFINAILEDSQQLTKQIKFNIAKSVL